MASSPSCFHLPSVSRDSAMACAVSRSPSCTASSNLQGGRGAAEAGGEAEAQGAPAPGGSATQAVPHRPFKGRHAALHALAGLSSCSPTAGLRRQAGPSSGPPPQASSTSRCPGARVAPPLVSAQHRPHTAGPNAAAATTASAAHCGCHQQPTEATCCASWTPYPPPPPTPPIEEAAHL
jgi:hypothetical protein